MRNRLSIFTTAACLSCATGNEITPKSEWSKLSEAKATHCKDWPLGEQDLEIRDIKITHVGGTSFLVSAIGRDGQPLYYLAPFEGRVSLDYGDQKPLAFGKKAVPLGASVFKGTPVAWLGQSDADGKGFLELRSLTDNTVVAKTPLKDHVVQEGDLYNDERGSWLFYRGSRPSEDGAMESVGDGYPLLARGEKGPSGLMIRPFNQLKYDGQPKMLASKDKALVVWPKTVKRDSQFFLKMMNEAGNVTASGGLSLKIKDLEGWAIAAMPNEYLIAYVEGDSLVGNATLQIVRFTVGEFGVKVVSAKRFPLANQHVSDPLWVVQNGEAWLMLLTWVDEESTASIYHVGASDIKDPILSGIFRKGSRIGGAFLEQKSGDLFSVMRFREGNGWKWQLCKADKGS